MSEDTFEINMDTVEDAKDTQQPQAQQPPIPEGVDPETWALAVALKKAKEDPQMAAMFARVAQPQAQQPAAQPQPEVLPEQKRLEEVRAEIAQLEEKLSRTAPDDPEYASIVNRIAMLKLEEAKLEPVVTVKREIGPLRQFQIQTLIAQLGAWANQRIAADPVLSKNPQGMQLALTRVNAALQELNTLATRRDVSLAEGQQLVETIIRNTAYEVMVPQVPYDPGVNAGQPVNRKRVEDEIPEDVKKLAEQEGIDFDELKRVVEELTGGAQ